MSTTIVFSSCSSSFICAAVTFPRTGVASAPFGKPCCVVLPYCFTFSDAGCGTSVLQPLFHFTMDPLAWWANLRRKDKNDSDYPPPGYSSISKFYLVPLLP